MIVFLLLPVYPKSIECNKDEVLSLGKEDEEVNEPLSRSNRERNRPWVLVKHGGFPKLCHLVFDLFFFGGLHISLMWLSYNTNCSMLQERSKVCCTWLNWLRNIMIKLQRSRLGTLRSHMNRLLRLEYAGCTSPLLCWYVINSTRKKVYHQLFLLPEKKLFLQARQIKFLI